LLGILAERRDNPPVLRCVTARSIEVTYLRDDKKADRDEGSVADCRLAHLTFGAVSTSLLIQVGRCSGRLENPDAVQTLSADYLIPAAGFSLIHGLVCQPDDAVNRSGPLLDCARGDADARRNREAPRKARVRSLEYVTNPVGQVADR
jgi:hypothetical protein